MLFGALVGAAITALTLVDAGMIPLPNGEIDKVHLRLESIREKCLVEELPEKTVVLGTLSLSCEWYSDGQRSETFGSKLEYGEQPAGAGAAATARYCARTPINCPTASFNIYAQDPTGHTVVRQQSKPADRLFLTAAMTGDHLICFQAMLTQYSPNIIVKLGLEVFIGDAGDPHITSPVEAQLNDLAFQISKAVDQANDLQREQTLQRDREQHFRARSDRINKNVPRWALFQLIILAIAAIYQGHHMRRFFRHKKLI